MKNKDKDDKDLIGKFLTKKEMGDFDCYTGKKDNIKKARNKNFEDKYPL